MTRKLWFAMRYLRPLIVIVIACLLWEGLYWSLGAYRFPELGRLAAFVVGSFCFDPIIEREGGGGMGFLPHIATTLAGFVPSLFCGVAFGVILAGLINASGFVGSVGERVVEFFRTLPPLIFIPFFFIMVGPGSYSVALTAFIFAVYAACVYALAGLRGADRRYEEQARLFGATTWQRWRTVDLPALLPALLGGLRVTSSLTLGIVIVAEYLGSPFGLGRTLKYAVSYSHIQLLFTSIIWCVILGLFADWTITLITRRSLRWTERAKQASSLSRQDYIL